MITSSSNSKIKHVCQLVTKAKARRTEQLFVVEGIRMAKEAPKELLKEVYVSTSFLQKKEQSKLLDENREILDSISDYLYEKETITGKEFMKMFRDMKGLPYLMRKSATMFLLK